MGVGADISVRDGRPAKEAAVAAAIQPVPEGRALHEVFAIPRYGGPIGQKRSPWTVLGLIVVTLGVYGFVWIYKNYEEMADHNGNWPPAPLGLALSFVPFVALFMMPWRVGRSYEDRSLEPACTATTGFWGVIPLVGAVVWLVRVQNAINEFWESQA